VPAAWLDAARKSGTRDEWLSDDGDEAAAGVGIQNNFGLTIGYAAIRYSGERVRDAAYAVGREIAISTLVVFAGSAVLASLAVLLVAQRLTRDVRSVEGALRSGDATRVAAVAAQGPFGPALLAFVQTTREAEREIAELRTRLSHGQTQGQAQAKTQGQTEATA
jgi:hypothetical protein